MKLLTFLFISLNLINVAFAATKADGIKVANLKGADLSLMNNHDPENERQNLDLLPGYEINLFASEPMFANPIHMVWDSRGRLWVACSWSYPQLKPGQVANDKIIILEDTDGDGKADKSTVFAEDLYLPTGIELIEGGCLVSQSPDILILKDIDGDDIADTRDVALTGFGIEDSHHSMSAWRRGPGGWIYFQEGIFLHTQVETQHGMVYNYNGGVYQYNPRTQELNVFAKIGVGNPWGHVFDKWGQSFLVDNPRINYLSPATGNSGQKINVNKLIQTTKQCGGDLVTGTHIPEELRGNLLSGRFKDRLVIRYEFVEDEAGFSAYVKEPLVKARHPNFRPVDVKMGPDGAIYVADWYNTIINHANHDFRDERRDNEHGRIWRITAKDRPLIKKPKLYNESTLTLLDALKSPEAWTRHQAKFEIGKKDPDEVLNAIETWVDTLSKTDPEYDHHLVEAIWACQNVERVSEKALKLVLSSKSGHARTAGARIIRYWHDQLSDPVSMIKDLCNDSFPRVRMEAILSAGFIPDAKAFAALLCSLDHKSDKFIETAFPQSVKALEAYWRPAIEAGTLSFHKPSHKEYAEKKAGLGFDKRLIAFIDTKDPTPKAMNEMKVEFSRLALLPQIKLAVQVINNKSTSLKVSTTLLEALLRLNPTQPIATLKVLKKITPMLEHTQTMVAKLTTEVLAHKRVASAGPSLLKLLENENKPHDLRQAASIAIGLLDNSNYLNKLKALAASEDIKLRSLSIFGIISADTYHAAELTLQLFQEKPEAYDPVAYVQKFSRQRSGSKYLAEVLLGKEIHPDIQEKVLAVHRKTGILDKNLKKVFENRSSQSLSKMLLRENLDKLAADIEKHGDPARGEIIYRRNEMACTSCHSIGPAGPSIGPNLVAIGSASPMKYIIESILEPNKNIAEHYENMIFHLTDNSVRMGVITFKGDNEIKYKDASQGGKEMTLQKGMINSSKIQPSIMPDGLSDQLKSRQEFLDLAKFVSVLGKPGPYANNEKPVIRKWRVAPAEKLNSSPSDSLSWSPAYSMVNGALPSVDLNISKTLYVEGYVNVQTPGPVHLKLNKTNGLNLWLDGKAIKDLKAPLNLEKGRNVLTFSVDQSKRKNSEFRVELEPISNSKAKFSPEGGI